LSSGGDDFVGAGLPPEWLWVGVVVGDVPVDGGLQIDDAGEDTAFEAPFRQRREEPLDRVQP